MASRILTAVSILLLYVLAGCHGVDSGASQLLPRGVRADSEAVSAIDVTEYSEADIIEQVAVNREAYKHGLEALIAYYRNSGNNMKLQWAENELKKLDEIPKYDYIVEASVAGANLKAQNSIPLADYMYEDGRRLQKKAGWLLVVKDENLLRQALQKYEDLIGKHPSSDKIDDAAFRAGQICEYFKDYTIAQIYYQRAYQWDSQTPHPAMFKEAYILDRYMAKRDRALELYRQALEREKLGVKYQKYAQTRVEELTKAKEGLEEEK